MHKARIIWHDVVKVPRLLQRPNDCVVSPFQDSNHAALAPSFYPSGRRFPSLSNAVGHAFVSPITRDNRFTRRYEMDGWDRDTEREVDWVSGACMLLPRSAFESVGGFDEGFPLYAEELDIATRLRDAGWRVVFTPTVEVIHAVGVSTGGDRRPHRLVVMHSASLYRYYRLHRAAGWRRVTLPLAWLALRVRAEVAWLIGKARA